MRATNWEFTNRALIFGLIFGFAFPLYAVDPQTSTAALARWLGSTLGLNPNPISRVLFGCAAFLLIIAAIIRTWASSYLDVNVVYASELKTQSLVADGPYRHVRNPLYLANVLMAIGMGAMMSRTGFVVAVAAMLIFSYRLILREERELQESRGEPYLRYVKAVPRLWPSSWPRIAASGRQPRWRDGFRAESWYWGFAAAAATFALTLNVMLFFVILAASIALFWVFPAALQKK
jgi:protein-S-isoprenylcysteine O-methyltransferase Ste14